MSKRALALYIVVYLALLCAIAAVKLRCGRQKPHLKLTSLLPRNWYGAKASPGAVPETAPASVVEIRDPRRICHHG